MISDATFRLVLVIAFCFSAIKCDVNFNTSISSPRDALSLIEARSNLYFVGGFEFHDNVATNKIEVFDLINRTWSTPLQLPSRRAYVTPVLQEPYLYFVGGYEYLNPPFVYNPSTQNLTRDAGQGPSVLNVIDISLHESTLTVVGAYSVDFLDLTTNKWNNSMELTKITMELFNSITLSCEDIVVILGGTNFTTSETSSSVWIYNRTADILLAFPNTTDNLPSSSNYYINVTNGVIAVWSSNVVLLHRLGDPDWHQLTLRMSSINAIFSTLETTLIFSVNTFIPFYWSTMSIGSARTLNDFQRSFYVDGYVGYLKSARAVSPAVYYWDDGLSDWTLFKNISDTSSFIPVRFAVTVGEWACFATKDQMLVINIRKNSYSINSTTEIIYLLAGNNTCHFIDDGTKTRYYFDFETLPATLHAASEVVFLRYELVACVGNSFFTPVGGVFNNEITFESFTDSNVAGDIIWTSNNRYFVMMQQFYPFSDPLPKQYYNQVDIYDLDEKKWLNSITMPFTNYAHNSYMPATTLGDKLVVWNNLTMAIYDPLTAIWTNTENGTLDNINDFRDVLSLHIPVLTVNDTAYLRTKTGSLTKYHAGSPFEWTQTIAAPFLDSTVWGQYLRLDNDQLFISTRDTIGRNTKFATVYLYDIAMDTFQTTLVPSIDGDYTSDLTMVPVGGFIVCFSTTFLKILYYEISTGVWYDQPYDSNITASAVYQTSLGLSFVAGGTDEYRAGIYSSTLLLFEADSVTAPPLSPSQNETVGPRVGLSEGELIAAIVVPIGAALIAGALLLILLLRKKRKQKGGNIVSMTSLASKYGQWFIPFDQIKFGDQLGRGASGQVFKGSWKGSPVALKVSMTQANKTVISELELMIQMRPHPNVVQLFGFSVHPETDSIILVIEYCDGGSLDDLLFETNQQIPTEQKIAFLSGIAKGLSHLHSNNIVHRDVAARNVLLHKNETKLTDFGMSRLVEDDTQRGTTKSELGPIRWMSPESLRNKEYSDKSDVWSFGIVMFEVIAQQEPHLSADPIEIGRLIRDNGVTPDIPEHCPSKLASIMRSCWKVNPAERPMIESLIGQLESVEAE